MFEISMNIYNTLYRSLTSEAPLYLLPLNRYHILHSTVNYGPLAFQPLELVSRLHRQNFHPNHTQPANTTHFSCKLIFFTKIHLKNRLFYCFLQYSDEPNNYSRSTRCLLPYLTSANGIIVFYKYLFICFS